MHREKFQEERNSCTGTNSIHNVKAKLISLGRSPNIFAEGHIALKNVLVYVYLKNVVTRNSMLTKIHSFAPWSHRTRKNHS